MTCEDCGGCTDDRCPGGCGVRFCGGSYMGEDCDRCPEKVLKTIALRRIWDRQIELVEKDISVRCNGARGHFGTHHWDPRKVGRPFDA